MQDDAQPKDNLRHRNRIAGGVLVLIGLFVVFEASGYDLGSFARMGPGFVPIALGVLVAIVGALIALVQDDGDEDAPAAPWLPAVFVSAAVLAFALLIERAGLIAATAALVYISGFADKERSWRGLTILFVVLVAAVYLIFGKVVGIPFELVSGVF